MATKKPRFMITFESEEDLERAKTLAKLLNFRSTNALIMSLLNEAIIDHLGKEKTNVTQETRS
jgi:hypothetical protein